MNPTDMREQLPEYADGALDAAQSAAVEAYLAAHPEARAEVERWRALRGSAHRSLQSVPVPAGLHERVQAALEAERRGAGRGWLTIYRLGVPGLAAAAVVVALVALWPGGARATPVDAEGFARLYRLCAVDHRHDALGLRGCRCCEAAGKLKTCAGFACQVPDLGRCGRYRVDGACRCSPAKGLRVVHAFFRYEDDPRRVVSVFAVDRAIELRARGVTSTGCRTPCGRHYHTAEADEVHVAAWDEGAGSVVLVSEMSRPDLVRLVEELCATRQNGALLDEGGETGVSVATQAAR